MGEKVAIIEICRDGPATHGGMAYWAEVSIGKEGYWAGTIDAVTPRVTFDHDEGYFGAPPTTEQMAAWRHAAIKKAVAAGYGGIQIARCGWTLADELARAEKRAKVAAR